MHGIGAGNFTNAPGPLQIYGREHSEHPAYPNGYGDPSLAYFTMIGFDQGGWHLYAQDNQMGGSIANVRQIY